MIAPPTKWLKYHKATTTAAAPAMPCKPTAMEAQQFPCPSLVLCISSVLLLVTVAVA